MQLEQSATINKQAQSIVGLFSGAPTVAHEELQVAAEHPRSARDSSALGGGTAVTSF